MQQLNALHPRLVVSYDTDSTPPGMQVFRPGWSRINDLLYVHETQIDLSGYALQDLSFFPSGVGIQDPGLYIASIADPSITGLGMQVLDIITSVPMDLTTAAVSDLQLAQIGPGMLGSEHEYETILMGQYRLFNTDNSTTKTTLGFAGQMSLNRMQRFGSGEPTAADKLYSYRFIQVAYEPSLTPLQPGDQFKVPACRHILMGEMVEEEQLVHMFRLKRSYELANQL
jgi:hypothetical protein